MSFYHWQDKNLILSVHVQPRARQTAIVGIYGDKLKIRTTAAPSNGQANIAVCKLLAALFGVAQSQVLILSGHANRDKKLCIYAPKKLPELISVPKQS